MTKTSWQEQTFSQYWPDYSLGMSRSHLKNFIVWEKKIIKDRVKDALDRLGELGTKNDTEELKHHTLVVCFLAEHMEGLDYTRQLMIALEAFSDRNSKKKKLADRLIKLLHRDREYPKQPSLSIIPSKNRLSYSTRELLAPINKNVTNYLWTPIFIEEILSAYSNSLEGICTPPTDLGFERNHGPLLFPRKPSKQEQKTKTAENSLCFNLVFLFRLFLKNRKGHCLPKVRGAMPKVTSSSRKICYELTSDFANVIFCSEEKNGDEAKFTYRKVENRVNRLIDQKVELGYWCGFTPLKKK